MLFVFTLTVFLSLVLSQEVSVDDSKEVKTCFESNPKKTKECLDFFARLFTQTLKENTKNIALNPEPIRIGFAVHIMCWKSVFSKRLRKQLVVKNQSKSISIN